MVLNYLSKAAGFIFLPDPGLDVRGRVDVWSQHPVSKDEAIDLLNTILYKNGYAAIRNGRTINIMSRDEAKKRDIPVKTGSDPDAIPRNDEIVTQIIPVRYANALQMTKDLQPLLPSYATMTANESGNALVITDTQTDIRRMAQIVKALDTSISGISTIKVFPLRYADAKDLATELRELFPAQDTSGRRGGPFGGGFGRFAGPMGGGAPGSDPTVGTGQSEARRAASRVTAVADERTNSLIVSAPDEVMPTIDELVRQIDTNAENITELRVFPLTYADPQEMADILTSLFPDDSRSDTTRSAVQFGRGPFGMFGGRGGFGGANTQTGASTRARQKGRVTAVPDPRTASLIVSAASDLMPQIAEMIAQLDANPAKKQKVFVYSLQNADVDSVQQVLQEMFQSQNSRYSSSRQNFYNPLTARQQNQSFGTTGSGFSSGFGGTGFGGMGRTGTRTGR
jgi:type II secretory pathway component GspD/PulD (secretin)